MVVAPPLPGNMQLEIYGTQLTKIVNSISDIRQEYERILYIIQRVGELSDAIAKINEKLETNLSDQERQKNLVLRQQLIKERSFLLTSFSEEELEQKYSDLIEQEFNYLDLIPDLLDLIDAEAARLQSILLCPCSSTKPQYSGLTPERIDEYQKQLHDSVTQMSGGNSYGGGKNFKHANFKAREAAKRHYEKAKNEYESLFSQANKTPKEIKDLKKFERQMKHWKSKMDFTGENHSQGGGKS